MAFIFKFSLPLQITTTTTTITKSAATTTTPTIATTEINATPMIIDNDFPSEDIFYDSLQLFNEIAIKHQDHQKAIIWKVVCSLFTPNNVITSTEILTGAEKIESAMQHTYSKLENELYFKYNNSKILVTKWLNDSTSYQQQLATKQGKCNICSENNSDINITMTSLFSEEILLVCGPCSQTVLKMLMIKSC